MNIYKHMAVLKWLWNGFYRLAIGALILEILIFLKSVLANLHQFQTVHFQNNGNEAAMVYCREVSQNWNFFKNIRFLDHLKAPNERVSQWAYFLNLDKGFQRYYFLCFCNLFSIQNFMELHMKKMFDPKTVKFRVGGLRNSVGQFGTKRLRRPYVRNPIPFLTNKTSF